MKFKRVDVRSNLLKIPLLHPYASKMIQLAIWVLNPPELDHGLWLMTTELKH